MKDDEVECLFCSSLSPDEKIIKECLLLEQALDENRYEQAINHTIVGIEQIKEHEKVKAINDSRYKCNLKNKL